MTGSLLSRLRARLWERPGAPVTLLGVGYIGFGLVHLVRLEAPLPIDWAVVGLYELLSVAVVYGGLRVTDREIPPKEGLRVFGATVAFGFIGFLVAAGLITLQLRRGVPLQQLSFLMAAASVTTAAIGIGFSLYDVDLRAERANLAAQHETVTELNKRLTVLHRVLRHNLRNELTVLRGRAELLLADDLSADQERSLRTIVDHTRQMESLSENTYRLRQVWMEDVSVDRELTELIEGCVRDMRAAHPEIDVTTDLPAQTVARVDPRFELAVEEAIENAVVHNDPETVEITVSVEQLDGTDPAVEVTVADTGSGIPDFEFDVLEQVEERPLSHATGLGLWLIYWVVDQSGGELRFEENRPQGTVVKMRLPAPDS